MMESDRITATATAFEILDVVHRTGGASAMTIAERVDLSRGGVYKHVRTLLDVGALVNHDGTYRIGPKFDEYATSTSAASVVADQTTKVDQLSQSLDAPANLWVANGDDCDCIHTSLPTERENYPRRTGTRHALTDCIPGKAILAHLPEARQDVLIEGGDESIREQLAAIRERELLEESIDGAPDWIAIATPVLDPSDHPIAAIEVVIPEERAGGVDVKNNIEGLMTETASQIRVELL